MPRIHAITRFLDVVAPLSLAEQWDNVGLLVGDAEREASNVMTCLTLTPDVANEAVQHHAQLIVSHHPLLFRPVQQITATNSEGQMILRLIEAGIAVYSPHTAYDSARDGVNQQLAEMFSLTDVDVLRRIDPCVQQTRSSNEELGAGRCGGLPKPMPLSDFNHLVKQRLGISQLQFVGDATATIERVGIACGSAAEFLSDAVKQNCQVLLTGEARFHACLEAGDLQIAMVLAGHYATERPAIEQLAKTLACEFPHLNVWASQQEADPLRWT